MRSRIGAVALGVILVTLALGGCAALPGESANAGVSHDEAYDDIADAVRVASPEFAEVRIGEGAEGAETFLMVELDMIGDELPGAALDSAMLVLRESVPDSFDAVRVVAVSAADVGLDLEEPLLQTGVDGQTMIDPGTASIPVDALRDMRILG